MHRMGTAFMRFYPDTWLLGKGRTWFPPLLVALVVLAVTAPVLRPGFALYWGTPYFQFIPWRDLALALLREGRLPWWNIFSGLGTPLLANYQTAVFYPGTWLTWMAGLVGGRVGLAYAHGWWVAGHLFLAAWGMARFAQDEGLPHEAAWFAGMVYGLSGYAVARGGIFVSMNAAMAWTPWTFWAVGRVLREPSFRNVHRAAGVLALLLLAGHAQTAWYTLLLVGLWALAHRPPLRGHVRAWKAALLAGLWALALALGQLAATAEYTRVSSRAAGLARDFALQYSFWPWHYLNFLNPRMFGHPAQGNVWGYGAAWEDAVYIGVLPLFLALWSLVRRFRHVAFWGAVGLTAQVLALGWFTPIYPWLYDHIPTFATFQAPTRWHLWTMLALAVLAGHGVTAVSQPQGKTRYALNLALAAALGIMLTAWGMRYVLPRPYTTLAEGLAGFGFWAFLAGAGVRFLSPKKAGGNALTRWMLVAFVLTAADLAWNQQGWYPATPWDAYRETLPQPVPRPQGRFWMSDADQQALLYDDYLRFHDFRESRPLWAARVALVPNANLYDRVPGINAYDPLLPARFVQWWKTAQTWPESARTALMVHLGGTLEVRRAPATREGVQFVVHPVLPWVAWYDRAEWVPDATAARAWLTRVFLQGNLPDTLVLEGHPPVWMPSAIPQHPGPVRLEAQGFLDGSWHIEVTTPRPGFVLVRQAVYPGWRAWLDGQPTPLYPADGLMMAVAVPAGKHTVVIAYRPQHLYAALALQAAAMLFWGLSSFALHRRKSPLVFCRQLQAHHIFFKPPCSNRLPCD